MVSYFQIVIEPYAPNDQSGKGERKHQWNGTVQMNSSEQNLTKLETNNEKVAHKYFNSLKVKVQKGVVVFGEEKSYSLSYTASVIQQKLLRRFSKLVSSLDLVNYKLDFIVLSNNVLGS